MTIDQYSPCPCGSGKKFKWCCQPIHLEIAKAFQQDEAGQHDAALRLMDEVVAQHADNPEAWGKKALLLWQNEKPEEADAAITKALEVNPQYPFGHYLRGRFRQFEGEIAGALILFRKAAELYDPAASQILIEIYLNIFDCEMKLNRPVAAHAAGLLALKADPNNVQLRESLEQVFGPANPNLPAAALKAYQFQPTRKVGRAAWDQAMARINTSRLSDVLRAFDALAKADPEDPNVWYNLGLTHAWLGNNVAALEDLNRYLDLETDEALATQAVALGEILRLGQGMEEQSDYVEYSAASQLRDPQTFLNGLVQLEKEHRVAGIRVDQENGILAGVFLEEAPVSLVSTGSSEKGRPLAAFFMVMGSILRLWNTQSDKVDAINKFLRERFGAALAEPHLARGPAKFADILAPALLIPTQATTQESHDSQFRESLAKYFEETWIHRPLRALDNIAPVDAAGSAKLRKKVLGVVAFVEQVSSMGGRPAIYDFNRLRAKLNLTAGAAAPVAASTSTASIDIAALGPAELAGLNVTALDDNQLELAFQTAQKIDAKDLAGSFAQALVERPARAERPDRFPWFNHLVNQALVIGDFQAAINHVNDGEKHDCENNEGGRRNDYELRRGQVLVKQGDHQQAEEVFNRLIARVPGEMKYRGTATEAFLSARQGARALKFADAALVEARKTNNRDSEHYFLELQEAAKRG